MKSAWQADNPSKRWCEQFFLAYSVVWVTALLGVVVPFGFYEVSLPEAVGLYHAHHMLAPPWTAAIPRKQPCLICSAHRRIGSWAEPTGPASTTHLVHTQPLVPWQDWHESEQAAGR